MSKKYISDAKFIDEHDDPSVLLWDGDGLLSAEERGGGTDQVFLDFGTAAEAARQLRKLAKHIEKATAQ